MSTADLVEALRWLMILAILGVVAIRCWKGS